MWKWLKVRLGAGEAVMSRGHCDNVYSEPAAVAGNHWVVLYGLMMDNTGRPWVRLMDPLPVGVGHKSQDLLFKDFKNNDYWHGGWSLNKLMGVGY
jgi:hypothetical protein